MGKNYMISILVCKKERAVMQSKQIFSKQKGTVVKRIVLYPCQLLKVVTALFEVL